MVTRPPVPVPLTLGEINVVLAGKFADERGGADVGFFFFFGGAAAGRGRRWRALAPASFGSGRGGAGASAERRAFGWRSGGGSAIGFANDADNGVDLNGVAFGNFDFLEDAAGGGGDFGVDLVGGDLEERLVALDLVTGLLQPLGDGSFENRFAHLGHDYVSRHSSLSIRPCSSGGEKNKETL